MTALFLQGNSREVLRNLPANYFHCATTSPPYFGLRAYSEGIEVWDGGLDCEHEWGRVISPPNSKSGVHQGDLGRNTNKAQDSFRFESSNGSFCSKCGAWKGQLGAEPTPELYIQHLIQIMREVRRVLRPDGVFWLNIGDSWGGSGGAHKLGYANPGLSKSASRSGIPLGGITYDGVKPLDMVLIPEQLALAARADGWYVRSILIWAKGVSLSDEYNGNPMPESVNGWRWERCRVKVADNGRGKEAWRKGANVTSQQDHDRDGNFLNSAVWQDCPGCPKCEKNGGYVLRKGSWRPTDSYEHILMLTKTNHYFCDREAVLERGVYPAGESRAGGNGHKSLGAGSRTTEGLYNKDWNGNGGRNLRSVLLVPTTGYKGAHFAVYNPKLIEPLIKSATSEKGCCPRCGAPWARVIDKGFTAHDGNTDSQYQVGITANRLVLLRQASRERGGEYANQSSTIGWLPTCECGIQETEPCRVLDPFSGAGTTALVCERLGLDSIGVDTSAEYIQLAEARIAEDERKRIDEQIKQIRREVRMSG